MKNIVRILLLGLLTWVVPFFAGFFFYDRTGQLAVDIYLFKSIMIIVGGLIGSVAIAVFFKKIHSQFIKQAIIAGFSWFVINILFDILFLLPMSKMNMDDYIAQIGLRYLFIPIMCILCGYLLNTKKVTK